MTSLVINVVADPGRPAVVTPTGVIDYHSRDLLQQRLSALIKDGHTKLILDLERVPLCDSSGLVTLIQTHRQVGRLDGWLRLANAAPIVRKVLQITNLNQMIGVYDSVAEAAGHGTDTAIGSGSSDVG
jgi:anti-sigma B factor antagonist